MFFSFCWWAHIYGNIIEFQVCLKNFWVCIEKRNQKGTDIRLDSLENNFLNSHKENDNKEWTLPNNINFYVSFRLQTHYFVRQWPKSFTILMRIQNWVYWSGGSILVPYLNVIVFFSLSVSVEFDLYNLTENKIGYHSEDGEK